MNIHWGKMHWGKFFGLMVLFGVGWVLIVYLLARTELITELISIILLIIGNVALLVGIVAKFISWLRLPD